MLSRFVENISFGLTSGLAFLLSTRPDAVYANTWPVFASGMLACLARLRGVPVVISVQDIYPESLLAQNRVPTNGWIARTLRAIDGHVARSAAAVVVISEKFAQIYLDDRHVPPDRVHIVPNWLETSREPEPGAGDAIRAEMGIPADAFVIGYGGNIGAAAGVEGVIESLRLLPPDHRPYMIIAGSGSQLRACQNLAREVDPNRILFYTPWPEEKTLAVYAAADMLVLPTRGEQSLASMPSKAISYMMAGRPVLAQALPESDLANVVRSSGCGWVVDPNRPAAFAEQLARVQAAPADERRRRGQAGRAYALQNLTREVCLPRVLDLLESVAGMHEEERCRSK